MKTNTHQLIEQAARELQLENLTVEPDLETVGLYVVKWEGSEATIPMVADFTGIIRALKAADGNMHLLNKRSEMVLNAVRAALKDIDPEGSSALSDAEFLAMVLAAAKGTNK